MAIDAKVSFIGMMEKELAGVLTVEQMEKIEEELNEGGLHGIHRSSE